jgi:hypothetical protein
MKDKKLYLKIEEAVYLSQIDKLILPHEFKES